MEEAKFLIRSLAYFTVSRNMDFHVSFTSFSRSKERNLAPKLKYCWPFLGALRRFFSVFLSGTNEKIKPVVLTHTKSNISSFVLAVLVDNFHTPPGIPSRKHVSCKHGLRTIGRKALGTNKQPVSGRQRFSRQNCRL